MEPLSRIQAHEVKPINKFINLLGKGLTQEISGDGLLILITIMTITTACSTIQLYLKENIYRQWKTI